MRSLSRRSSTHIRRSADVQKLPQHVWSFRSLELWKLNWFKVFGSSTGWWFKCAPSKMMYAQLFRLLSSQLFCFFCSIGEAHGSISSSVVSQPLAPSTGATKPMRKGDLAAAEAWLRWRRSSNICSSACGQETWLDPFWVQF